MDREKPHILRPSKCAHTLLEIVAGKVRCHVCHKRVEGYDWLRVSNG